MAPVEGYHLETIDQVVETTLKEFDVPGIGVGVIVDGQVVLARGYGVRDVERKLPVTSQTLFPIGSSTKGFTTFLLAELVDKKLLSWDDPVQKHIPEFRLFDEHVSSQVTVRDLCAHKTGIPRHDLIWFCRKMRGVDVLSTIRYLEPVSGLRTKWIYNNFMYSIAGQIVERVTGASWEENVEARIFQPLQMVRSNTSIGKLKTNFSLPYACIDNEIKELPFHDLAALKPGGGINSNIEEMLKWLKHQQQSTFKETHALQMPLVPNEREGWGISQLGYGLGWFIGDYHGFEVLTHGGSINGFYSEVLLLPSKKIGIVILTNSSSDGHFAIASIRNTILDALLGRDDHDWIEMLYATRAQAKALLEEKLVPSKENYRLQDYVGVYSHPAYGQVEIELRQQKLMARYGTLNIELTPISESLFKGDIREALIFGVKRITDFRFVNCSEVHISFEPQDKPIKFVRS